MLIKRFYRRVIAGSLIIVAGTLSISWASGSATLKVVGYYASWNAANLPYNNIEYSSLTHIIVAFGTPNSDGSISYDSGIPFSQLVTAAHAAGTKVLISLGGAGSGVTFSSATKDSSLRAALISNAISFVQKNNYDGVDIDWETPGNSIETAQLTSLIQEMRTGFDKIDSQLLITMAIPPGNYGGQHFDYANLTAFVDWYNVMCYDFVGSWSAYSGNNSPLYQSKLDPNFAGSDSDAVVYNFSRGIPMDKLVLGVPFYGVQLNATGLYKVLTNNTTSNPYYADEVNDVLQGWTYHWDDISKVPYLTNSAQTEFITFEDTNSVKLKVEYASRKKLGGMMIWELSQDVYHGTQPLLDAIGSAVRNLTLIVEARSTLSDYKLYDGYPNPFNPSTIIAYQLPAISHVRLTIYDVLGRQVKLLTDEVEKAGKYQVRFDAGDLASGVYFYTLRAVSEDQARQDFSRTKKLLLLR